MTGNPESKKNKKRLVQYTPGNECYSYDEHCLRGYLLDDGISPERKEEIQRQLDWLTSYSEEE